MNKLSNKSKITIDEIARMLKISTGTVSRALNNRSEISTETKNRVLKLVNKLNFKPNRNARGLSMGKNHIIGVIVLDLNNPFYTELVSVIENSAYEKKYDVILVNTNYKQEKELSALENFRTRVDGIIFCTEGIIDNAIKKELKQIEIPIVFTNPVTGFNCDYVMIDNEEIGYLATKYLINKGYSNIGYIGNKSVPRTNKAEFFGYRKALNEYGIEFNEQFVIDCAGSSKDGYIAAKELINRRKDITAIFCYNDIIAIGTTKFINEFNIKNISIIGAGNINIIHYLLYEFPTVTLPIQELGTTLTEVLINKIENKIKEPKHIVVKPYFVDTNGTNGIK